MQVHIFYKYLLDKINNETNNMPAKLYLYIPNVIKQKLE